MLAVESESANHKPEHEVHQLKPLPFEEAVTVGWQHEAGAESIEQVLHHLLLLWCGRVVPLKHLQHSSILLQRSNITSLETPDFTYGLIKH